MSGQPAEKDSREGRFFYPWERTLDRLVTPFEEFIHRQTTSGMILLATSVLAVVLANSPFRDIYLHLTHPVAFQLGGATLQMSWLHLVNEGLMVFFFFVSQISRLATSLKAWPRVWMRISNGLKCRWTPSSRVALSPISPSRSGQTASRSLRPTGLLGLILENRTGTMPALFF